MSVFSRPPTYRILFVSSEQAPFAKVGGLGEVMFALPRALRERGHDVRVMIPRYGTVNPDAFSLVMAHEGLEVPTAPNDAGAQGEQGKRIICNVRRFDETQDPRSPVTTYFLENQEYYELRSNVYGYRDDRIRFALLARGCLEFLNTASDWLPDVIVASDWMTGFLPNMLRTDYRDAPRLASVVTVFSIHNLAAQGTSRHHKFLSEMERDDGHGPVPDFFSERMTHVNPMRRGITYADAINTVSARYAEEITSEAFGEGLDALLRERRPYLFGILNGIDYETNDPASDPVLARNFSARTMARRDENKTALQQRFGLAPNPRAFVMGIVSRLTRQKGFTLLEPVMGAFLKENGSAQLVVVGTGDTEIMTYFQELERQFPLQVRAHLQFDEAIPHLIFAGADVILVPSVFEPSGLTQMEAMRYGAIPVARRVGGLADTIEDYNPETQEGSGFLFETLDANAFLMALTRAFVNWRHKATWRKLQRAVMENDFSWLRSAKEYEALFHRVRKQHDAKREPVPAALQGAEAS
ncbi:MAG: glycogen synthase [bacterium]|nr:glycogen synthase [bacterium]MDZ4296536.1 glycogen synthase [Patescibacteria group bacterium]